MYLERLSVRRFRNCSSAALTVALHCNVRVGRSAHGKTNLLEATAFLATVRSACTARKGIGARGFVVDAGSAGPLGACAGASDHAARGAR